VVLALMVASLGRAQTAAVYTDLHGFGGGVINADGKGGSDGNTPWAGATINAEGDIAGTTRKGGAYGLGMVWEIKHSGSYQDIHDFGGTVVDASGKSGSDGRVPYAGVTFDAEGDMFGTTYEGGPNTGAGMIWEITKGGAYIDLHDFGGTVLKADGKNGPDGLSPYAGITFDAAGDMFGTTSEGGAYANNIPNDDGGIVWEISKSGIYRDLYDFGGIYSDVYDGSTPYGGVTFDSDGNKFGTTLHGGANGHGMAWELNNTGAYKDLHDFGGTVVNANGRSGSDGSALYSGASIDRAGDVVGTCSEGGAYGGGIVWKIAKSGTYSDIHDFEGTVLNADGKSGPDGLGPYAGVIFDSAGNAFGTTEAGGGSENGGMVWEITASGTYEDLHDFGGNALNIAGTSRPDGFSPFAGVAIDGEGVLVGTTSKGGPDNSGGTLWKISLPAQP
jgi:hypothetical protein